MKKRFWREYYVGNYTLYCGRFNWNDFRIGIILGNKQSDFDLGWFTFGYMK